MIKEAEEEEMEKLLNNLAQVELKSPFVLITIVLVHICTFQWVTPVLTPHLQNSEFKKFKVGRDLKMSPDHLRESEWVRENGWAWTRVTHVMVGGMMASLRHWCRTWSRLWQICTTAYSTNTYRTSVVGDALSNGWTFGRTAPAFAKIAVFP